MKPDPEMVQVDGVWVCAQCGDPLNDLTVAAGDPFCRTACANEWHEFEPLSRNYTLSGHPSDNPRRSAHPALWDTRTRTSRREREVA